MAALTLADLQNPAVDLTPVVFLGKDAFIKKLSFDAQMKIAELDGASDSDQLKAMLSITLCCSEGILFFESIEQGAEVLGNIAVQDIMNVFDSLKIDNGLDSEAEIKN